MATVLSDEGDELDLHLPILGLRTGTEAVLRRDVGFEDKRIVGRSMNDVDKKYKGSKGP